MTLLRAVCMAAMLVLGTAGAVADDCVSLLKAVSQPGVFPNRAAGPIAWNGSMYGVAKAEGTQFRALYFAFLDAELNPASADILVAPSTRNGAFALYWTGTEFTLFYETREPRMMLQRISAAGAPIGPPVPVATTFGIWNDREFDLIWDAGRNAYALAYTVPQGGSRGLWLAIINPDGTLRSQTLVNSFVSNPIAPQIAATSAGLVLLFHSSLTGQMHSTLYVDGSFTQAFGVARPGANGQLEWNGSTLAYVTSSPVSGGSEIHWTRLDARGKVVNAEARWFQARGSDAAPVHLFWNPNDREWALAYRDSSLGFDQLAGDYRLGRFTAGGALLSDTFFSPEQVFATFDTVYPFVWNGSAYISTISRLVSSTAGTQSYAIRNCPIRATALSDRRIAHVNEEVRFSAVVNGGVGPFTYEWDLGDVTLGNVFGASPVHRYRNTGTYTVTLTVIDSLGAQAVTTTTVNVVVPKRRAVRK